MFVTVLFLLFGLALLFAGGEALVRGGVSLAHRLRVPPLVVGLTVVGFGTSTPELLVSIQAALDGLPDIALGNVIGSNTANILLILGLSALISPMVLKLAELQRDLGVMIIAACALLALGFYGAISQLLGFSLFFGLVVYLTYVALTNRNGAEPDVLKLPSMPAWKEAATIIGGLAALIVGANYLVESSTIIARSLGVSEAVIGLTIVAVGTSLPELATSVIAAYRRESEVAIGNVVGSNIFNILGILGLTAIFKPMLISPEFAHFDIPVMLGISVLLVVAIALLKGIGRLTALGFLATYTLYLIYLF